MKSWVRSVGEEARGDLLLRLACLAGLCDSIVALGTALLTRPHLTSIIFGLFWVGAWGFAATRPRMVATAIERGPVWALPAVAVVAMVPAILDGGHPGTLGTQPIWLVLVAAASTTWKVTVATGVALFAAKLTVFLGTGTAPPLFGDNPVAEAQTALLMSLALIPLSLVLVAAGRRIQTALTAPPEPYGDPTAFTPAQAQIVDLLADGLSAKEIAVARGTSVETVRTQIKQAKRSAHARTQEHLVAITRRRS